ncbi:DUF4649 family protein [Streptococcus parauberis]|uniref:DUF4649 family protein n=1 Tax=Streptococcus parauberis TaxID=1348 RepID=UPI000C1CA354|nr:DUF4649 family protein [Streptococcus parauberis]PIO78540.1 hypothetical protein ADO05_01431 [Streptococcus parauberis]POS68153.1 hypothetical protein AOS90_00324 [Streptococcus parauberis]
MIKVSFLNESKQEKTVLFLDFKEFERAQVSCDISTPDYHPVISVTVDGQELYYQGTYGDLYFYLLKRNEK